MKSKYFILLICFLSILQFQKLSAQDHMNVYMTNGSIQSFAIDSIQKITFDNLIWVEDKVHVVEQLLKMKLYPNPASQWIEVEYELVDRGKVSLEISSMNGKVIDNYDLGNQLPGRQHKRLNLHHYRQGEYVCIIRQNNQFVSKIIIVKH